MTATGRQTLLIGLGRGRRLARYAGRAESAAVFEPPPHQSASDLRGGRGAEEVLASTGVDAEWIPDWRALNLFLTQRLVHGPNPDLLVVVHPQYAARFPQVVDDAQNAVRAARVRRLVVDKTLHEKGRLFFKHLTANARRAIDLPSILGLKDAAAGLPGYIVGSGPGLEKNGDLLKEAAQTGLIIAAGSAYRPLLSRGVVPDVVVVVEAEDTRSFLAPPPPNPCILAVGSTAHPGHFEMGGFIPSLFHLNPGAAYLFGQDDFLPQGGTSGSAAFTLGLRLGLNPLVLVGQDQAFEAGKVHAGGTPGDVELTSDMTAYSVCGINGGRAATHSGFAASLHWYAESALFVSRTDPGRMVVNASEAGAHIPGVADVRLADIVAQRPALGRRPNLAELLADQNRADPGAARREMTELCELVGRTALLFRLSPQQAQPALTDLAQAHPLLTMALADLSPHDAPAAWKARLAEVEDGFLHMLSEVA